MQEFLWPKIHGHESEETTTEIHISETLHHIGSNWALLRSETRTYLQ